MQTRGRRLAAGSSWHATRVDSSKATAIHLCPPILPGAAGHNRPQTTTASGLSMKPSRWPDGESRCRCICTAIQGPEWAPRPDPNSNVSHAAVRRAPLSLLFCSFCRPHHAWKAKSSSGSGSSTVCVPIIPRFKGLHDVQRKYGGGLRCLRGSWAPMVHPCRCRRSSAHFSP